MPRTPEDVMRDIIADQAVKIAELQAKVRAMEQAPDRFPRQCAPYGEWTEISTTWSQK